MGQTDMAYNVEKFLQKDPRLCSHGCYFLIWLNSRERKMKGAEYFCKLDYFSHVELVVDDPDAEPFDRAPRRSEACMEKYGVKNGQ